MRKVEPIRNRAAEGALYTIGKLAKRSTERSGLRCTPAMIYNYERLGLMPRPRKTEGGTRRYGDEDVERLALIKRLQREVGESLGETKAALALVKDPGGFRRDKAKLRRFILEQRRKRKIGNRRSVGSKEARKRAMTDAALELFEKKGYHSTTIADITSASGTSHGTFYLHFKNKQALIQEIVDTVMEATWRAVEEADPKEGGSMARILAMAQSFFQIDKRYQRMAHVFVQGAARDKRAYDRKVEKVYRKVSAPFIEAIGQGIVHGEFRCGDAKRAAFEIVSLVELFRYRSIFEDRFVFGKFGPDLEGFREGRQMRFLQDLIEGVLDPAPPLRGLPGAGTEGQGGLDGRAEARDAKPRGGKTERGEDPPQGVPMPEQDLPESRNDPLKHCRSCEFFETCEKFCNRYFE